MCSPSRPASAGIDVLENALEDSSHLLLAVSAALKHLPKVPDGLAYANDKGKEVIPLILDGTEPPLRARRFQQVIFHPARLAAALHELLQALPHSAPAAAAEDIRLRFWQALLKRLARQDARHAGLKAHNRNTLVASAGVPGFKLAYVIRQHGTGVSLIIDRGSRAATKAAFDALVAQRAAIETAFGGTADLAAVGRAQAQPRGCPVVPGRLPRHGRLGPRSRTALIEAMAALEGALEGKLG